MSQELVKEIKLFLDPLIDASESIDALYNLLFELGWELDAPDSGLNSVRDSMKVISHIDDFSTALSDLIDATDDSEMISAIADLMEIIVAIMTDLGSSVSGSAPSINPLDKSEFWENFGEDLFGWLVYKYFKAYHLGLGGLLELFGIIETTKFVADVPFLRRRVNFGRIPRIFYDIPALMEEIYNWGSTDGSEFKALLFLNRLGQLAKGLGFNISIGMAPDTVIDDYYTQDSIYREFVPALSLGLYQFLIGESGVGGIWLAAAPIPAKPIPPAVLSEKAPDGIVIFPVIKGAAGGRFALTESLELNLNGELTSSGVIRVEIRPGDLKVSYAEDLGASINSTAELKYGSETPSVLIGSASGPNLQIMNAAFKMSISGDIQSPDVAIQLDLTGGKLIIPGGTGDGFLKKALPSEGIQVEFEFSVDWSEEEGLRFRGSAALEITLSINKTILDVIKLESIYLAVGFNSQKIDVKAGVTGGIKLGPIAASIKRIGVVGALTFPQQGGNLGKANIDLGFLPPTGAGLAISGGALVGGGFLDFDDENKRYSGALGLKIGEIGVTAICLITTRMPDGSDGFSMVANIGVTFDPAIQLYMGFTLSGVGGLFGVNRTMDTDVLRDGLKKGILDSILFPDPATVIANASQIISDMRSVFPPEEGRFVVGPMVLLGWGTPNVITGEIGVFLELPSPIRVALMGQVGMKLPKPDDPIVEIRIDILGVLDMEKKELSFQASIFGNILAFDITGDTAFLLSWGEQPEFALAIGGFHPNFPPPPPPNIFSGLRRLGLHLSYGSFVELSCGGYMALTPNSLQFGARVDIYVGVSSVDAGISGFMSFDAMFIFSPFSFQVDVSAGMSIRVKGHSLADIRVNFVLSGPTPWNIRGTATVHVLFWDIDIGFNESWGRSAAAVPESHNPWPQLEEALLDADSWAGRLPPGSTMAAALRSIEDDQVQNADGGQSPSSVVVHPAGTIEIRQNIVPLDLTLSKFGNANVIEYDRFAVDTIQTTEEDSLSYDSVDEFFARGQFENLSSSQKLSLPSFEKMPAGATTKESNNIKVPTRCESQTLGYESILINSDRTSEEAKHPELAVSKWSMAQFLSSGNSAGRCPLRSQGKAKFAHRGEGMVGTKEEKYLIVSAETLQAVSLDSRVDLPKGGMSRAQADQALKDHLLFNPGHGGKLLVIAEYEVEEAA